MSITLRGLRQEYDQKHKAVLEKEAERKQLEVSDSDKSIRDFCHSLSIERP